MEWLLSRIPELKKRAYLAKYLVKVDLPPEVAADPDVSELYEQVLKYNIHSTCSTTYKILDSVSVVVPSSNKISFRAGQNCELDIVED